jgi:hypothetical protein
VADPCEKEHREYTEAREEWVDASNVMQSFAATSPLEPGQDVEALPIEEFRQAAKREEAAHEDYIRKMEAYYDCRKRHKGRAY